MRRTMEAIIAELGAAEMQFVESDDAIIVSHVREALRIARASASAGETYIPSATAYRMLRSVGVSSDDAAGMIGDALIAMQDRESRS